MSCASCIQALHIRAHLPSALPRGLQVVCQEQIWVIQVCRRSTVPIDRHHVLRCFHSPLSKLKYNLLLYRVCVQLSVATGCHAHEGLQVRVMCRKLRRLSTSPSTAASQGTSQAQLSVSAYHLRQPPTDHFLQYGSSNRQRSGHLSWPPSGANALTSA